MKAYTDIEQSKKLSKILPIESADMCYRIVAYNPNDTHVYKPYCLSEHQKVIFLVGHLQH